jgi:general secretion pathway protein I
VSAPARCARRTRGFTLIEVLVALVIVAFGMGAVLSALSSAADNETRMREKTFAEWVGLNQLSTERLQVNVPAVGKKEADVDFAGTRWHWQENVETMDIPGLLRITIQVRHADSNQSQATTSKVDPAKIDWLATIMGFRGDAIQTPVDVLANWDGAGTENQQTPSPTPTQPPTQTPTLMPTPTPTPAPTSR